MFGQLIGFARVEFPDLTALPNVPTDPGDLLRIQEDGADVLRPIGKAG